MICHTCHRRNPAQAWFCWFDGAPLQSRLDSGDRADAARMPFALPFSFPSGRVCRSFEELALACEDDWATALVVLRKGLLERFFHEIYRADLAAAAHEGARLPDVNQGLDYFLSKIP